MLRPYGTAFARWTNNEIYTTVQFYFEMTYRCRRRHLFFFFSSAMPVMLLPILPREYRTLTYQRSFFICTSRIWNSLLTDIKDNSLSLASFKNELFEYYTNALLNIFNPDNPKTWKSVCPKCNMAQPLVKDITCCF